MWRFPKNRLIPKAWWFISEIISWKIVPPKKIDDHWGYHHIITLSTAAAYWGIPDFGNLHIYALHPWRSSGHRPPQPGRRHPRQLALIRRAPLVGRQLRQARRHRQRARLRGQDGQVAAGVEEIRQQLPPGGKHENFRMMGFLELSSWHFMGFMLEFVSYANGKDQSS